MISNAIDAFPSPLMVHRATVAVEFVDGVAQPTTSWDEFEIVPISVQPMVGRERLLLPELIRDREVLKAYTRCELKSVGMEDKLLADRVTFKEQRYVVQSVEDWSTHGEYWKAILVKEDD